MIFRNQALAFAAVMLLAGTAAPAATVPNPVNGELFVGFRVAGGEGASTSYLVKLGTEASFNATPGTPTVLSLGNLALDLAATYGSDWATRSDLFWGVFGVSNNVSPTVFASKERLTPGAVTAPWEALDTQRLSSTTSYVSAVINSLGGYRGSTATANSPVATLQQNSSQSSSYFQEVAEPGTTDFGSLSGWSSIEGDFGDGTAGSVLDLYRISSAGVTRRGSFSINDQGQISFTAIPEPSTALTLLGGSAVLASVGRWRRRVLAGA